MCWDAISTNSWVSLKNLWWVRATTRSFHERRWFEIISLIWIDGEVRHYMLGGSEVLWAAKLCGSTNGFCLTDADAIFWALMTTWSLFILIDKAPEHPQGKVSSHLGKLSIANADINRQSFRHSCTKSWQNFKSLLSLVCWVELFPLNFDIGKLRKFRVLSTHRLAHSER